MSENNDDLREVLRRRAGRVPPHREVPRSLAGRARRRIALNAIGVGLAVAVLAGGAFAGVRAFRTAAPQPAHTPPPSASIRPTPPAGAASACTSGQLQASGSMQGAAGSLGGGITVSNVSGTTCTLQGKAVITLLDRNGNPITSGITYVTSQPEWVVNRSPQPPGWPVVKLRPGRDAFVRVRWSNWCPQGRAAPTWQLAIPGGGSLDVNGFESLSPPPCNGPGQPSTVERGPFEPLTKSSSPATVTACTSSDLRAAGSMQGAAGSREGGIVLTNTSGQSCTLQGSPTVTLLDQNGNPITSGVMFIPTQPQWAANASPQPPGWPVVTVQPGRSAFVRIRWGNWCPQNRAAPSWQLAIPGGGTLDVSGMDTIGAPPCNGPGQPSTIEEGPFEPGTSH